MGAGILPVSVRNGKLYFLFGKENKYADTPGWSDFGGGTDGNETPQMTVIREGQEELTGFLGGPNEIKTMLSKCVHKLNINNYTMFVCPMEYNEWLPFYYNNNQRFLQTHLDQDVIKNSKIFEKSEIKWFSESELRKLKPQCRSYFQNIVEQLMLDLPKIRRVVRTKSKTRKR